METGNDLPHHDLGERSLDRSLADTLPVRRERSDYLALAQLRRQVRNKDMLSSWNGDVTPHLQTELMSVNGPKADIAMAPTDVRFQG